MPKPTKEFTITLSRSVMEEICQLASLANNRKLMQLHTRNVPPTGDMVRISPELFIAAGEWQDMLEEDK